MSVNLILKLFIFARCWATVPAEEEFCAAGDDTACGDYSKGECQVINGEKWCKCYPGGAMCHYGDCLVLEKKMGALAECACFGGYKGSNCSVNTCPDGQWPCQWGVDPPCMTPEKYCDGIEDCYKGHDEWDCFNVWPTESGTEIANEIEGMDKCIACVEPKSKKKYDEVKKKTGQQSLSEQVYCDEVRTKSLEECTKECSPESKKAFEERCVKMVKASKDRKSKGEGAIAPAKNATNPKNAGQVTASAMSTVTSLAAVFAWLAWLA